MNKLQANKIFKKAINKHKAHKYADAETLYKKILRNDKSHLNANYMLGTLYAEQNKLDGALKYLNVAEKIDPISPFIQNNLGNAYRLHQQYELAINHYRKALAVKPDLTEAYNNLGNAYKLTGNTEQAAAMYQQAIASNPGFIDAHFNFGNLYWDIDDFENAYPYYAHVLMLNPDHAKSHDKLGTYYLKTGEVDKARAHFETYLGLDINDTCGVKIKIAYLDNIDNNNTETLPAKIPEQLVRETYEKKAFTWDKNINRPKMEFLGPTHIKSSFDKYHTESQDLVILDIGCGTGLCGEFLQEHAYELVGVDLSQHMLSHAQQKNIYTSLEKSDIVDYLTSSNTLFDVIVGSGILIFYGDLMPLLTAARQRLRPQGHFIFTLYKSENQQIEVRENMHFAHSIDYLQNIIQQTGFKLESLSEIIHEYDHGKAQPGLIVVLTIKT